MASARLTHPTRLTDMANIAVLGALDTKGAEVAFLRDQIAERGHAPIVIDVGVMGEPAFAPAITRTAVAAAAGHDVEQARR